MFRMQPAMCLIGVGQINLCAVRVFFFKSARVFFAVRLALEVKQNPSIYPRFCFAVVFCHFQKSRSSFPIMKSLGCSSTRGIKLTQLE